MALDPNCPHCGGTGWREVERGGVSAVERCSCFHTGGGARARLEPPERYRDASFENFRCKLPGDPNDYDRLTAASFQAKRYAEEYPLGKKKGLLLQGPTGTGKTHLAFAALKTLAARGFDVVYFDYQTLLQRIRESYNPAAGAGDRAAYRAALDAEVLLLDDLGAHRATDWVLDTVTEIVTYRYNENKALLTTTNLRLRELGDATRVKNPDAGGKYEIFDTLADRIGDRAVSRLFEMCSIVRLETQDYRRREL